MDDKIEFCNCFWEVMESCSMIAGNMFRLLKPENNIFIVLYVFYKIIRKTSLKFNNIYPQYSHSFPAV